MAHDKEVKESETVDSKRSLPIPFDTAYIVIWSGMFTECSELTGVETGISLASCHGAAPVFDGVDISIRVIPDMLCTNGVFFVVHLRESFIVLY